MPVDKNSLKVGDKIKLSIKASDNTLSSTAIIVGFQDARIDAKLDCSFDFYGYYSYDLPNTAKPGNHFNVNHPIVEVVEVISTAPTQQPEQKPEAAKPKSAIAYDDIKVGDILIITLDNGWHSIAVLSKKDGKLRFTAYPPPAQKYGVGNDISKLDTGWKEIYSLVDIIGKLDIDNRRELCEADYSSLHIQQRGTPSNVLDNKCKSIEDAGLKSGDKATVYYDGKLYDGVYINFSWGVFFVMKEPIAGFTTTMTKGSLLDKEMIGKGCTQEEYPHSINHTSHIFSSLKVVKTEPDPPKKEPEPAKKEEPEATVDVKELKPGERIKFKVNEEWEHGTFICHDANGFAIVDMDDTKLAGARGYISTYSAPTRDKIKTALSDLGKSLETVYSIGRSDRVARADIDPPTLRVGDVVEIEYKSSGYAGEATVVEANGNSYPVVFNVPGKCYLADSNDYGRAKGNARALGLPADGDNFVGWKREDTHDHRVVVKRLVKRPAKSIEKTDLKSGDHITILRDNKVYEGVYIKTNTNPYLVSNSKPEWGYSASANSAIDKAMKEVSLSLGDYPYYASLSNKGTPLEVLKSSSAPKTEPQPPTEEELKRLKTGDRAVIRWQGNEYEGVYVAYGSLKQPYWVFPKNDTLCEMSKGCGLEGEMVISGLSREDYPCYVSPSDNKSVVRLLDPLPNLKPPVYLDLTKENLQPGDTIVYMMGNEKREAVVLHTVEQPDYFLGTDLYLAIKGDAYPWLGMNNDPFSKAAAELNLDPKAYGAHHRKKSDTNCISIDRSQRIDRKSFKPGTRLEIEIYDDKKVWRHTTTVVQNTNGFIDLAFDTEHSSLRYRTAPTNNTEFVEAAKLIGIDPKQTMLRISDGETCLRVVKEIKPDYILLTDPSLEAGDKIELEITAKSGARLKRTGLFIATDDNGRARCWLDKPISAGETGVYCSLDVDLMGSTKKMAPILTTLGLSHTASNVWVIDDHMVGSEYGTRITKIIEKVKEEPKPETSKEPEEKFVPAPPYHYKDIAHGTRVKVRSQGVAIHLGTVIVLNNHCRLVCLDQECTQVFSPNHPWGSYALKQEAEDKAKELGLTFTDTNCGNLSSFTEMVILDEVRQPKPKDEPVKEAEDDGFVASSECEKDVKNGTRVLVRDAFISRPGTVLVVSGCPLIVLDQDDASIANISWYSEAVKQEAIAKAKEFGIGITNSNCANLTRFREVKVLGETLTPTTEPFKEEPVKEQAEVPKEQAEPKKDSQAFTTLLMAGAALFGGFITAAAPKETGVRVAEPEFLEEPEIETEEVANAGQ